MSKRAKKKTKKNPHAVALGRRGGSVTSPKKAASSRRNGREAAAKRRAATEAPSSVTPSPTEPLDTPEQSV
jgi:hypothetical protein